MQKLDKQGRAYATGKRKNAVARVWLKPGSGKIMINEKTIDVYFARPVLRMMIQQPFVVSNRAGQFDVSCTVSGGGLSGQAGALRHGISKALYFLRAGVARRAEEGRLHDPRFPRGRAQKVRPQESPPELPVLEALIGADRGKSKSARAALASAASGQRGSLRNCPRRALALILGSRPRRARRRGLPRSFSFVSTTFRCVFEQLS